MITNYSLTTDRILFTNGNGQNIPVYLTEYSGRIIYRNKVNTLFGVDHPGIILGKNASGQTIVVHHHYLYGKPILQTITQYADGEVVKYDPRKVYYSRYEIVKRALSLWRSGVNYNLFVSNCQHFINRIATNKNYSESVDRAANGTAGAGALTFLAGLFLQNPFLMKTGAGLIAGGGIVKAVNRL